MFKFSYNFLKKYLDNNMTPDEIFKILNTQGFEFQGKTQINNDIVTAIEVKANRPDMLSHIGIAREIKSYLNQKTPEIKKNILKIDKNFPVKINIENNACKRYSCLIIKNLNNNVKVPDYIRTCLESMGVNSVNPVVDILNYVMFDLGQPLHAYDLSKISGSKLDIKKSENSINITTLNKTDHKLSKDDIVIFDAEKPVCLAGVIGLESSSVDKNTRDILLESAIFDEISVRLTSRATKISTPSSFRFERGVNSETTTDIMYICAELIQEICGGEISPEIFDYYNNISKTQNINLDIIKTNKILGTDLTKTQIINYLEQYNFKCEEISDNSQKISVKIPDYRLDVTQDIDLIEEVARIHGYDNIPVTPPTSQIIYNKNQIWDNMNKIREILLGANFSETINYSFIPSETIKKLDIKPGDRLFSDLVLQNPITESYNLMRPSLVYSLVNTLAYNYSVKNTDLALFELGRVYFKSPDFDTGYQEIDTCGFIISGTRIFNQWGCTKNIKFDYYDIISYLNLIMSQFGQKFELKNINLEFCEKNTACEIIINNKPIGFLGELNKNKFNFIKNTKLIRDKIFYCEFYIKDLNNTVKKLEFESKYPPIIRQYNFVYNKQIMSKEVINIIKSASNIIQNVTVKDIYTDKNMPENTHAVLYEINYCSTENTLTSENIEQIEQIFINNLEKNLEVKLKI